VYALIAGLMAIELLIVATLVIQDGCRVLAAKMRKSPPSVEEWPVVAVIVPVAGSSPMMVAYLESILSQDYPSYEVLFVTRTLEEDAAGIISQAFEGREGKPPAHRHVVSGSAATCGQKNHSLLEGVRRARKSSEVLVFCDSTHMAPRHWLKSLVAPIAKGEARITAGYHRVVPGDKGMATLMRAVIVLILNGLQGMPWLQQPWGGNTAITRECFNWIGVADVWVENIVDDVSLAALLRKRGVDLDFISEAELETPIENETMPGINQWLRRQLLGLKFCLPGMWTGAGLVLYLLAVLVIWAPLQCVVALVMGDLFGCFSPVVFLAVLTGLMLAMRLLQPGPKIILRWLGACYGAIFVAALTHLKTWFVYEMDWGGIRYQVTRSGKVRSLGPVADDASP
jgi:cellulose synthase/poly-beta-1,6-N-acetylglucosamine synthase-like glycosyltransferase